MVASIPLKVGDWYAHLFAECSENASMFTNTIDYLDCKIK